MSEKAKPAEEAAADSSVPKREPVEVIAMRMGIVGKRNSGEPLVYSIADCAVYEEPLGKMGYAMGPGHGGPKNAWQFNAMKAHERWAIGAELTEEEFNAVRKKVCEENSFR